MIITEMDKSGCMDLLRAQKSGSLACSRDGQPYVVPITYAADGNNLYSFSLVGQKIEWMRGNPKVCVQVDEFAGRGEWRSVVAYGRYEELPDVVGWKVQREKAWSLLSRDAHWWEPGGLKPVNTAPTAPIFYRIVIEDLTGRRSVAAG